MIDIHETFTVTATPDQVYRVLSDPAAVVECVAGASLGGLRDDGSYDGTMTVKFGALRVSFAGRVRLELDDQERRGTVTATGRDGQGGTKFQAAASFTVTADGEGARSVVAAKGEIELTGKLAAVIENAATAVVRRMTGEFIEALTLRCASGEAELAASQTGRTRAEAGQAEGSAAAVPVPAVLLLHGFGGSPGSLRAWGEALADAGAVVSVPLLPGHGTRWRDLDRTGWADWQRAAATAFHALRGEHGQVFVMGISLGATLALRLAEDSPGEVAGVVAVNPVLTRVAGTPRMLSLTRLVRRSSRAVTNDIKKPGVTEAGYDRIPLRAAASLRDGGATVRTDLGKVAAPVLLCGSAHDHVAPASDSDAVWAGLAPASRQRVSFADSYHVVPLDNDAGQLFAVSTSFVRDHALTRHSQR